MRNPGHVFFELCDSSPYLCTAVCTLFLKKVCFQSVDYCLRQKGLDVAKGFSSGNLLSPDSKFPPPLLH